jgi:Tfp pilus assembly protein PilF
MSKACKLIKEAIEIDPSDADNWITWGLILRKVGSYKLA